MPVPFYPLRVLNMFTLPLALLLASIPLSVLASEADLTRHLSEHVRSTGRPTMDSDTFFGTEGAGRLIVVNGNDSDSRSRVTSAVITLNGEKILGPNSFKKKTGEIEVPVDLMADNSITVEVRGRPGSSLSVRVKQMANVSRNITSRIHFNTNVSNFTESQAFYQAIGLIGGFGFPDTNTWAVAEAIGVDTPTSYDGS